VKKRLAWEKVLGTITNIRIFQAITKCKNENCQRAHSEGKIVSLQRRREIRREIHEDFLFFFLAQFFLTKLL
jgi:Trk-type K+ transport system membrane component